MGKYRKTEATHDGVGEHARHHCWRKRAFATTQEAREAIDAYHSDNRRRGKPLPRMRIYTCSLCNQIHIGRVFAIPDNERSDNGRPQ